MRKAIVLAAGKGTRMKSDTFKVLHTIGNRSMIGMVLDTLKTAGMDEVVAVLGPNMENVANEIKPIPSVVQTEALGTAHAALAAEDYIHSFDGSCTIVFGDTPLIKKETFEKMHHLYEYGCDVVVLGFEPEDPARYGRLVTNGSELLEIVEYKDATDKQREIGLCNAGVMCLNGRHALDLLKQVKNNNAAHEYYLPDVVKIAREQGLQVGFFVGDKDEIRGVNSRAEQAAAEAVFQREMQRKAFDCGVTLQSPDTVYFSYDTTFESDVIVEAGVYFGVGVHVCKGARVKAFSRLENETVKG